MSLTTKFKFLSEIGSSICLLALNCFLYNYNSITFVFSLRLHMCYFILFFYIFLFSCIRPQFQHAGSSIFLSGDTRDLQLWRSNSYLQHVGSTSFLTKARTQAPCIGSVESQSLDHQESPYIILNKVSKHLTLNFLSFSPQKLHLYWVSVAEIVCCCHSVAKSRPTLCHHMDCSTPGSSVLYCLPEFAQVHVH